MTAFEHVPDDVIRSMDATLRAGGTLDGKGYRGTLALAVVRRLNGLGADLTDPLGEAARAHVDRVLGPRPDRDRKADTMRAWTEAAAREDLLGDLIHTLEREKVCATLARRAAAQEALAAGWDQADLHLGTG